jgi:hypothetical protein
MLWWIVPGVAVAALLVLATVVLAVLRRLPRLGRALGAMQRHQAQAFDLRESAERLQARLLTLQARADQTQQRIATIAANQNKQ